jgi:hypothetical protein
VDRLSTRGYTRGCGVLGAGVLPERPTTLPSTGRGNDGKQWWVLSASVAATGRAVLYDAVFGKGEYDGVRARERFLRELERLLPPSRRVIIVADSGFRVPFLEQLARRNWDYVVRLRGRPHLWLKRSGEALRPKDLHRRARLTATSLGPVQLRLRGAFACRQLVLFRTRRKHRKAKDRLGRVRRWQRSRHYAKAWREPWVLLTSLPDAPDRIRHLYAMRMAIEETFRDIKNPRLGMGFAGSASRQIQRVRVLWLIGAIAMKACRAAGEEAERAGIVRGLQANTVRNRRGPFPLPRRDAPAQQSARLTSDPPPATGAPVHHLRSGDPSVSGTSKERA